MRIELHEVPVQDIVQYTRYLPYQERCHGYSNDDENGVFGMGGKLNIRPKYQREFVYKDKQRNAVIQTIKDNFPLNVLYFAVNNDGSYEVIDGQQRLISICQYIAGDFSLNGLYFHNLLDDPQDKLLDYKLMVYFCDGTDQEKLDWFRTINIAGEKLTEQELRNAVYSGPWVTDAKRYFSRTGCPAYRIANRYLKGEAIRQDYLETVIDWISGGDIEGYMSKHQHDKDAKELWGYFESAIGWIESLFINYRKEMKGVCWGSLYNEFKNNKYDPKEIEARVSTLMQDEDVTKKSGIYTYIFTGAEKELSIRKFSDSNIRETYERQKGICIHCKEHFEIEDMEADHITPWSKGGKTVSDNCQMLCLDCNRRKSDK